jgi:hypothetical protein
VVSNATLVSSTVENETLDGCHVAKVTLASLSLTFHVVVRVLPPLAPLAPDFVKTMDHIGVSPKPNGHEVPVPPPRAPFLATDRAGNNVKRKQQKKEARMKKQKDSK